MGEAVQEAGAVIQLDEQGRDRRERQHPRQFLLQRAGLGGDVLSRQRRDHQIPVIVQPDGADVLARGRGQHFLQILQGGAQLGLALLQRLHRIAVFAGQRAELTPFDRPLRGGEQVTGRVSVAARPGHVDVTAAQPVADREQHAQLPVVPVGRHVSAAPGLGQVIRVPARHETGGASSGTFRPPEALSCGAVSRRSSA